MPKVLILFDETYPDYTPAGDPKYADAAIDLSDEELKEWTDICHLYDDWQERIHNLIKAQQRIPIEKVEETPQ